MFNYFAMFNIDIIVHEDIRPTILITSVNYHLLHTVHA